MYYVKYNAIIVLENYIQGTASLQPAIVTRI